MGSGERRIWTQSVHPEPSPAILWVLSHVGKVPRPAGRNSPAAGAAKETLPSSPPHPSGLRPATYLPPKRKVCGRNVDPPLQRGANLAPSSASHSLGTFPPRGRFRVRLNERHTNLSAFPSSVTTFGRATFPPGKAFGRPQGSPLRRIWKWSRSFRRGQSQTGPPGFAPGALARQSQARKLNRNSNNFCKDRAQWPGGNLDQPLRFCAPEILHSLSGKRPPVMGDRG